MSKNYGCGGTHCTDANSEIRVLPTGGDSNALLCKDCFYHEIIYRKDRNKELGNTFAFKIPDWNDLKIYDPRT